jgi:hypothetical protein
MLLLLSLLFALGTIATPQPQDIAEDLLDIEQYKIQSLINSSVITNNLTIDDIGESTIPNTTANSGVGFCWRNPHFRHVSLARECQEGFERVGTLCYPKCNDGYYGID